MEIRKAMEEFLQALKESSAYKDYKYQKERVKRVPGLSDRINEFRVKRFEFQNYQGEDLFEKVDEFERQYETFREEPMVREYLAAELEICRLVQEINDAIVELVDIDMEIM
ncbi:MAG: YlbF family regulator [Lachnospiraceae bacterium]|nr:YlbF family regulator [Lachnospiraceae bacterium]